jgi:hypothetical protein
MRKREERGRGRRGERERERRGSAGWAERKRRVAVWPVPYRGYFSLRHRPAAGWVRYYRYDDCIATSGVEDDCAGTMTCHIDIIMVY